MNPFRELLGWSTAAVGRLQAAGELPAELDLGRVAVDPPRDPAHGEAATNAALVLAKAAGKPPMALAGRARRGAGRAAAMIAQVGSAAPGFVNLTMAPAFWQRQVPRRAGGRRRLWPQHDRAGAPVNVEFCSANPTGPLHAGHSRGTVFGDALANVLGHAGFDVTREYYVNDGGAPDRDARPLAAPALPRGAGRGDRRRSPRASIPAST